MKFKMGENNFAENLQRARLLALQLEQARVQVKSRLDDLCLSLAATHSSHMLPGSRLTLELFSPPSETGADDSPQS